VTAIGYRGLIIAAALAVAIPAYAQDALPVAEGKPWTHRHSGIVIPAALDELPRVRATSFVAPELDISQNFASEDGRESLTVYIFRNTNGSVPLWFAQVQRAIGLRADLADPPLGVPPVAFTPPGQGAASGIKAVFAPKDVEGIRSTGVALFAVGDWYVKLRANSATLTPADLSDWMEGVLSELTLPRGSAPAAAPIAACTAKMRFAPATADSTLPDSALGVGVKTPMPPMTGTRWCLDHVVRGNQAVYRTDEARDHYLLTTGDNGKAIVVAPQGPAGAHYYSANFVTADRTFLIAPQDAMPSPQRVIERAGAEPSAAAVMTWPAR
jgi:hypothetical protein